MGNVLVFIFSIFLDLLGWRYALLANCSITTLLLLCGALIFPSKPKEASTETFDRIYRTDSEDGLNVSEDDKSINR